MTAATLLACAFPPSCGLNGARTTIRDLSRYGMKANRLFAHSKRQAVRLIVQANMDAACAYGHGNRAAKREAQAFAARMHEECNGPLTERDLAKMEANYAAKRTPYVDRLIYAGFEF